MVVNNSLLSVKFITKETATVSEFINEIKKSGGEIQGEPKPFELDGDSLELLSNPFVIISCAVSIGFLIKRISDVWLNHTRSGGPIIDVRDGKVVVYEQDNLEHGTIVIIGDDEHQVFKKDERDKALEALNGLISPSNPS